MQCCEPLSTAFDEVSTAKRPLLTAFGACADILYPVQDKRTKDLFVRLGLTVVVERHALFQTTYLHQPLSIRIPRAFKFRTAVVPCDSV